MNFKIVHRGAFNESIPVEIIKQNLSQLLDLSIEEVTEHFFSNQHYELIHDLSNEDAQQYAAAVRAAGAIVSVDLDIDLDAFTAEPTVKKAHKHQSKYTSILSDENLSKLSLKTDNDNNYEKTFKESEHSQIMASRKKNGPEASNIEPYLFYPSVRIGRARFIVRILMITALLLFINNVLNIRLLDRFGAETASYISITLLSLLGLYFLIVITQRLSDINRPMILALIVILPLIIAAMATFSIRIDKMRYEQVKMGQSIADGYSLTGGSQNRIDSVKLEQRIAEFEKDPHKLFNEYKYFYLFSYIVLAVLVLALFIKPGDQHNNSYGAPTIPVNALSFISLACSFVIIIISLITPISTRNYAIKKQLFDAHFFNALGVSKYLSPELQKHYEERLNIELKK